MSTQIYNEPFVDSIFHPTDFSTDSMHAFASALSIALARKCSFTVAGVGSTAADIEWSKFPPIRTTLERWGCLETGSDQSAVFDELRISARKVALVGKDPVGAMTDYLADKPADLIILATEGREGLPRWIRRSRAEKLARETRTMTLFVPSGSHGVVSLKDGSTTLRRVLVPVDHRPSPQSAIEYARRATRLTGEEPVEIFLLHVGGERPRVDLPEEPGVAWTWLNETGEVVDTIVRTATEKDVDLTVMATEGRRGVLDALRGTVTEKVLRRSPCPLLAVPMS